MVTNNYFYTCSTADSNFCYTNEDWEKSHSPYDGKPWWGIVPPPTYYDLKNMKTNTTTALDNKTIVVGDSYKIIDVNAQEIYNENIRLKEEIKSLKNDLDYWKRNYQGVYPPKYKDDLERMIKILESIRCELKERA